MLRFEKHGPSQRDRELLLGNLVTWGSILTAFILAISLAPGAFAEADQSANPSQRDSGAQVAQVAQQDSGEKSFNW